MKDITIPPELVHKKNPANQWINGWIPDPSEQTFSFVKPQNLHKAGMSELIELHRQAGTAFAHLALGVPLSHHFMLTHITVQRTPIRIQEKQQVLESRMQVRLISSDMRSSHLARAEFCFTANDGSHTVQGRSAAAFITPKLYARIRSSVQAESTPCSKKPALFHGVVEADWNHPLTSDHDTDHLPAISLIVAAENAIQQITGQRISRIDAEFHRYLELSPAAQLRVFGIDDQTYTVVVSQHDSDHAVFTCRIEKG